MNLIDALEVFREALIREKEQQEMLRKTVLQLQKEFEYLRRNSGKFQYTVKEVAEVYQEHPSTIKARIKKHGIVAIGKRGRSYTYSLSDFEQATLFPDTKTKSRVGRKKDYFKNYRKEA